MNLCEIEASPSYTVSFRAARAKKKERPCLKTNKTQNAKSQLYSVIEISLESAKELEVLGYCLPYTGQ